MGKGEMCCLLKEYHSRSVWNTSNAGPVLLWGNMNIPCRIPPPCPVPSPREVGQDQRQGYFLKERLPYTPTLLPAWSKVGYQLNLTIENPGTPWLKDNAVTISNPAHWGWCRKESFVLFLNIIQKGAKRDRQNNLRHE